MKDERQAAMLDILPPISLFEGFSPAQLEILKSLFEAVQYPSDTVIIAQGELADYLYLTLKGVAAIHYKPYDGPSLILARLHAGDVFGWSAVVGSRFYTSTIISEADVEAIRVKGSDLLALIEKYPETGSVVLDRVVRSVSQRWQHAHEQAEILFHLQR